jgi:outer membrane lipoprotein-sorting protein
MRAFLLALSLAGCGPAGLSVSTPVAEAAGLPSADELLGAIDANMTFETRTATVTMTVIQEGRQRVYVMRSMSRGLDQAATEYLEPARDKGTKMLRLGQDVWTYLPSVERTQKISGQMLRQGLMGSDLSYEDMMGSSKWRDDYTAVVTGAETLGGIPCWRVEMNAKNTAVAYPKRVAWVAQDSKIPVRQELYALSGMLLKQWDMGGVQTYPGGRQFPTRMVIIDKLKKDSMTILSMSDMKFGVSLEAEVFSTRWLERR